MDAVESHNWHRQNKTVNAIRHTLITLGSMYTGLHDVMREAPEDMSPEFNDVLNAMQELQMKMENMVASR